MPIGQPEFVTDFLEAKSRERATLFQRIPWVQDTQAAFLLLLVCGSTRANFWLRTVKPELTERFAERHNDASVWECLSNILETPSDRWRNSGPEVLSRCVEHGEEETPRHCR